MFLKDFGLVLEGGGMRGVFTSGVLDALMQHDIHFPYVVGVSAGACNGLSYASWQPGRAHFSNIDLFRTYDYLSLKHLIRQGSIFDADLLYDRLPRDIYPYNYEAYFKSNILYEQVVTNCLTGRAEYLSEHSGNSQRLLDICHASSSLPYVSKIVYVDNIPYLDGGIVDSIPVKHAFSRGYKKLLVVLTRNKGYRKSGKDYKIPRFIYGGYPRLRVCLSRRNSVYNKQLEYVEQLEDEGKIHVIRPQEPLQVDRLEKDLNKLEALYQEGFMLGEQYCKELENS